MSTYFYAACHDCRVVCECSNAGRDVAEQLAADWQRSSGHESHNVEVSSEHDDEFGYTIRGHRVISYDGHGSYTTEKVGEPYRKVERESERIT